MKNGLIGEVLRDRTVDFADKFLESPWLDRFCLAIIGLAALYFAPIIIRVLIIG